VAGFTMHSALRMSAKMSHRRDCNSRWRSL
jgi:hypothetical protein